jgi:5-methylcytosine-specific restriction endonuclease McrA
LVRGRFCEAHKSFAYRQQDERRGTAPERGYDRDWAAVANQRRRIDCYLCQACLEHKRLTPAKTVDHIIPLHVRPDWRLVIGNTQVICLGCHQRKTASDNRKYGSSTATTLNPQQVAAREHAQTIRDPPRHDETPCL